MTGQPSYNLDVHSVHSRMFYFGCPTAQGLDWRKDALLESFSKPFIRLAKLSTPQPTAEVEESSSASVFDIIPQWRSFPLEPKHLTTGFSQDYCWQPEYQGASFFSVSDVGSVVEGLSQKNTQNGQASQRPRRGKKPVKKLKKNNGEASDSQLSNSELVEEVLSQFYEESYARHEEVSSSQLVPASSQGSSQYSSSECFSFDTTSSAKLDRKDPPNSGPLNHLKDFPNSFYLDSIQPGVMVVNLIVGIISIPEPRTIRTKRGANVELVEALVGDETKSGFGINFWLGSQSQNTDFKQSIRSLRPQDVVLMRNVALDSFRGKVYGQNSRKGFTTVHLLYRSRVDRNDTPGYYTRSDFTAENTSNPQLAKTKFVREWVLKFLGGGGGRSRKRGAETQESLLLPPDTQ